MSHAPFSVRLMTESSKAVDLLCDRLSDATLVNSAADLVLAAALGDDALVAALGGEPPEAPKRSETPEVAAPAMFIGGVTVAGFRGVADETRLGFRPGPGLTLVVGRNGSGKSSFADAAELALTGTSSRWSGRTKVWEEGWANLHHDGPRSIELRVALESIAGETIIRKRWSPEAALDEGKSTFQRKGEREHPLSELGLDGALGTWRPFLSYSELGGLLDDGPSRLYDTISSVLGLDEWVGVERRLSDARKQLETDIKAARSEADRLRGLLTNLDDERAAAALVAMPVRKAWDLDAVESLATGAVVPVGDIAALESLAGLSVPDIERANLATETLRHAIVRATAVAETDAGRAQQLADLLEQALARHNHSTETTCPVCGTHDVLDEAWRSRTTTEIARLRAEATEVEVAQRDLKRAAADVRSLVTSPPPQVDADVAGIDLTVIREAWHAYGEAPDDLAALADHVDQCIADLAVAVAMTRETAATELRTRQDLWQPIAAQLASWLPAARTAQQRQGRVDDLKTGAAWLADEANAVRNERFAPIAARVQAIWDTLRYDSNVSLDSVTLEGTKTRRRVELAVSVDDVPGAALSVMSQGELHGLALSLFIPRASLEESPFRFILIDDPVQAMDAARVDGLARVLADASRTHQVVVFTHDERLPDAARRLNIEATVLEVTRGDRSQLSIRARSNPVDNYLDDARAVLATTGYPEEARRRVIPGLCRNALEAACTDVTHRRMLHEGRSHRDIDDRLEHATKLLPKLALALFSDAARAGDVLADVNRRWGTAAADCVQALKSGAHRLIDEQPDELIRATGTLARGVTGLP